jgi:phosphoribosylanthranilate isomerase
MTQIKICGLSRPIDIDHVNALMPDYVGFVFAKSKREVSLSQAESLIAKLDKEIKTVGVFVNETVEKVQQVAGRLGLNVLQLHGEEDVEYIKKLSDYEIWKSISIKNAKDLKLLDSFQEETILLDSKVPGEQGGTGIAFDWDIIKDLSLRKKIILAGGLHPRNVAEAISKVKPFAVDVSSGVETDGFKDLNKMEEFIRKVRII